MPNQPHVHFIWEIELSSIPRTHAWIIGLFIRTVVPDEHSEVICYTEYKYNNTLLCAHPNYYGGEP